MIRGKLCSIYRQKLKSKIKIGLSQNGNNKTTKQTINKRGNINDTGNRRGWVGGLTKDMKFGLDRHEGTFMLGSARLLSVGTDWHLWCKCKTCIKRHRACTQGKTYAKPQ